MIARKLYEAGYTDLVSVIPPDAPLSPNSRIAEDQRGKVPGLKGMRGWYGYRWDVEAPEDLPDRIDESGANVGIRGARFPGLDLDTDDPALALAVMGLAHEYLGPAPVRLSRGSRRLLMYRTDRPFKKRSAVIEFRGQSHTVEMLADGQQYLVHGTHPSGSRYRWESFPADPAKLIAVDEEKVDAFFRLLQQRLGEKGVEVELMIPGQRVGGPAPIPDRIMAGARNTTLASIAGTFRQKNLSEEAALIALRDENQRRCDPPLSDDEVRRIVQSIYTNYAPGPGELVIPAEEEFEADPTATPRRKTLDVVQVGEILKRPYAEYQWLVDGIIPTHGLSLMVAKPKVGKSTLARALAVAVAQGKPFLGREVSQGPVVYLMFFGEGGEDEFKREMTRLGLGPGDDTNLYLYQGATSKDIMERLHGTVEEIRPRLVIVDTMQNVLQASDLNDYAIVGEKFGPLHEAGAHTLLLHHAKKGENLDLSDGVLGSTKIFGSVEVGIALKRDYHDRSVRYLEALGREGVDIEPQVLTIDPDTHWPEIIGARAEILMERMEGEVVSALAGRDEGLTRPEIEARANGRSVDVRAALDTLMRRGVVVQEGRGVRGDPFRYRVIEASDEFSTEDGE